MRATSTHQRRGSGADFLGLTGNTAVEGPSAVPGRRDGQAHVGLGQRHLLGDRHHLGVRVGSRQLLAQPAQFTKQLTATLVAQLGAFGHHLVNDGAQVPGQVGTESVQRFRLGPYMLQSHLEGALAAKRRLAGQHVVAGHPEGINVGAGVERFALHLLGTHVQRSAHGHPALRQVEGRLVARQAARQAEVRYLHFPLARQQDVLGLDVSVDNAQFGSSLQSGGHLAHDAQRQRHIGRPLAGQELA